MFGNPQNPRHAQFDMKKFPLLRFSNSPNAT
jgi:hypothetical protein